MPLSGLNIALIAMPPTLSAAFAALLCSEAHCEAAPFSCAGTECDQADVLLTTVDHFLAHLDFFLPRKSKVAVLYDSPRQESSPPVTTVYLSDEPSSTFRRIADMTSPDEDYCAHSLTSRELDVLKEIAAGKTNKEIADSLCISVNTVITHRKNVSQKLGIRSASGLSLYALMNGLI